MWAVVAGFEEEQRRAIAALALVKEVAPDRYAKLVADFIEKAEDVCRAAGWEPPPPEQPEPSPAGSARIHLRSVS